MSNTKKCPGLESFQRMNYLYQASNALITENFPAYKASNHYTNLMINVSKKSVQRIDIEVKRTICKGCRSLLLPGITSKVRIKKKKVIHHCVVCTTRKVFMTKNRNYTPWTLKSESLAEILEYNSTKMKSDVKESN
ncbi:hypothetical protein GWI33_007692 [Rhynchophorus ferrugineus]|uniref:Uncharacterized protein n=1 Tax=Rhynchophorus ferrugineus TaxID=354439 RepID=A0A834MCU9_RHYFE|nr:hypothetical protein GWI33_007692 [Rhynchophorus ferrugineus]